MDILGHNTYRVGKRLAAAGRATKEVWTKWSPSCKCGGTARHVAV